MSIVQDVSLSLPLYVCVCVCVFRGRVSVVPMSPRRRAGLRLSVSVVGLEGRVWE